MQPTATRMAQRNAAEQNRARALVRFNGLAFHSLAAASFLETAVPLHVNRLAQVFSAYPEVRLWLEKIWWPRRAELGRRLREAIETTWPEFEWNSAYQEFYESYHPRSGLAGRHAGPAHEALGLCVTSAQAAVFYRALAHSADEPALRSLARQAAHEHANFFDFFRALFERCKRTERVGFAAAWRTAVAISRSARDDDVAAAFAPLGQNWSGISIVPGFSYPEYRKRMAQIIRCHAALGWIERLLLRPWRKPGRAAPAARAPEVRAGRWLPLGPQPA